jgi:mannosyltransferase OCH1-like enzyme
MPELRLVKVIVQPVFILDHGTHVSEVDHPPVVIPAEEWPTYSSERFPREVMAWQERLDSEDPDSRTAAPAEQLPTTPPAN